jgi:hypothetical protein
MPADGKRRLCIRGLHQFQFHDYFVDIIVDHHDDDTVGWTAPRVEPIGI